MNERDYALLVFKRIAVTAALKWTIFFGINKIAKRLAG